MTYVLHTHIKVLIPILCCAALWNYVGNKERNRQASILFSSFSLNRLNGKLSLKVQTLCYLVQRIPPTIDKVILKSL